MSNVPSINYKHRVCIICEGLEESIYLKKLISLNIWNDGYTFSPRNAQSASNIFPTYQDAFQSGRFEIIIVFCDTDKKPYREYSEVKKKINEFHHKKLVSNKTIIFANPCTLQIVLSHFGNVHLKTQGKKTNAPIVLNLTGVEKYDATEEQINKICSKISRSNYQDMKSRVSKMNYGDEHQSSTNFYDFLLKFESDDFKWIEDIEKYILK